MTTDQKPALTDADKGLIAQPQYAQDFTGMASAPFSKEACAILAETPKDEDVALKPDGICYMEGVWYRRQLTRAFGAGAWALKPTGPARTVGNIIEWPGALYILGRWVAEAVGGQATSDWMNHADAIQGAKTDCLSKCCGHGLTMASELWNKDWRESWMNKYATKEWQEAKAPGGKGKYVFKLKEKREGRDANLMGTASGSTAPATGASTALLASRDTSPPTKTSASTTTPASAPAASTSLSAVAPDAGGHPGPKGDAPVLGVGPTSGAALALGSTIDTGEVAPKEAYEAIAALMKKHGFTKAKSAKFLGNFGVDRVTALTAVQADGAHALLSAWGTDLFDKIEEELQKSGVIS